MVLAEDRILPTKNGWRPRVNDPEGTKRNIVDVATREFAQKGYGGARVDAIADAHAHQQAHDLLLLRRQGGLYLAVLEEAYSSIRRTEATLDLERLPPETALRTLVAFTFDYYNKHPEFVRLVMNENIMDGVHMARSKTIGKLNVTVIDALRPAGRPRPARRSVPARHRPDRAAHVDQRARHLQRRQPRHLLDHLQRDMASPQGAGGAAGRGRRHRPAARLAVTPFFGRVELTK